VMKAEAVLTLLRACGYETVTTVAGCVAIHWPLSEDEADNQAGDCAATVLEVAYDELIHTNRAGEVTSLCERLIGAEWQGPEVEGYRYLVFVAANVDKDGP
jgi:hypothetical protein